MRLKLLLTISLTASLAVANAENWTSSDGRSADMTLLEVTKKGGEKTGKFRLPSGKTVRVKASDLSDKDSKRLVHSVFDSAIEGNLLRFDGESLQSCEDADLPKKFYVFYYTASWCPPCQAFTPTLVDWYEKNKNDNFELVLISSDRDKTAMEGYAKKKKMLWPQLKLESTTKFKSKFNHGVRGIPSLIVCDLEGKNLGNFRSNLGSLTDLVKD